MREPAIDVSVIVPIYNAESYLYSCVSSLVNQTTDCSYEIILVNDGSVDSSVNIIDDLAQKYSSIVALSQNNQGPGAARNMGIKQARGSFCVFVDVDDTVTPRYIDNLFKEIKNEIGYGVVVSGLLGNGKIIQKLPNKKFETTEFGKMIPEMDICFNGYSVGKMYNINLIKKYNLLFDTEIRYAEDLMFYLQYLLKADWVKFIDKYDYQYAINNPNSLILSFNTVESEYKGFLTLNNLFFEYLDKYPEEKYELIKSFSWISHFVSRTIITLYRNNLYKDQTSKERKFMVYSLFHDKDLTLCNNFRGRSERKDKVIAYFLSHRQYTLLDLFVKTYYQLRYNAVGKTLARILR